MITNNEYAPYYESYINLFKDKSILIALEESQNYFLEIAQEIKTEKENFAYAFGKWTIKEVLQHIIDTERVFTYRALCIARGETINLPGFDQDIFVKNSNVHLKSLVNLIDEMRAVRQSTLLLFKYFTDKELQTIGLASHKNISVRAIGYVLCGHQLHHMQVIKDKYLF